MSRLLLTSLITLATLGVGAGFLAFGEGPDRRKSAAFVVFVISLIVLAGALTLAYFSLAYID